LEDRRAARAARHSPGAERANIRALREIPVFRFGCALLHHRKNGHLIRGVCSFSAAPYEESHPAMQAVWLALRVRIRRSKIGKRLAQRGIFQTQGEGILAAGEIPVFLGNMFFYLHELKAPMQSHRCFCIFIYQIFTPWLQAFAL
ncbi:MAG: hypothetical protein IJF08_01095, partial [Clostridia bacterium]|nr:hypothetical protein [Clostridia bacterium]